MSKILYCLSNKSRAGEFIVAEIEDPQFGPAWTERVLRKLDADGYRMPLRIEFARKLAAGAAVSPAVARVLYRTDTGTPGANPVSLTEGYTTSHMSANDILDIFRLVVPATWYVVPDAPAQLAPAPPQCPAASPAQLAPAPPQCPAASPARPATPPYWKEECVGGADSDDDAEDNVLADSDYTESASTSRKQPRARYGCNIPDGTFVRCWAYATPSNGLGCDQRLDSLYNSATREFTCKDGGISFSSITKMSEYHYAACNAPNPRTGAWNKCQYYHRETNAWRPLVQLKAAASECCFAKLARRDA